MSRGLAHRAGSIVAVVAGSALLAAPAFGGPASTTSIRPAHNITVFHNIDMVGASGYAVGTPLRLDVVRHPTGIPVGRFETTARLIEGAGGLLLNHPPEGDCWGPITPDVRPGDRLRVTELTGAQPFDELLVDDLLISSIEAEGPDVRLRGNARYGDGSPIPDGPAPGFPILDSAEWRLGSANRGTTTEIAVPGDGTFTAFYRQSNGFGAFQGSGTQAQLISQAEHVFGYGHAGGVETQLVQGQREANGPFVDPEGGGCGGRASAANDLTVVDDPVVNIESGALNLSGPADDATTGITATLEDADGTVVTADPTRVSLEQGAAGKAWDAQFNRADLALLDDGPLTATVAFDGAAPATATRSLAKDTLAPAAPTATPGPGSYEGDQFVGLDAEPGATIRFLLGAGDPAAGEIFGEAIRVSEDTTIRAVAIDAAGNESADAEFEYDIRPPVQGSGGGGAAGGAAGGETGRGGTPADQGAGVVDASTLRASSLRTRSRVRLAGARRRGVTVSFVSPPGATVARVELFRVGGAAQRRALGTATVVLGRSGRHSVRLASSRMRRALRVGLHRLVIRVGTSRDELGAGAVRRVRIVR